MKIFTISKKNGKQRRIYAPDFEEKANYLYILNRLKGEDAQADTHNVAHGFRCGRSPVTNAMQHIGWQYTLTLDLQDFFPSVTHEHLARPGPLSQVDTALVAGCFFDGAAQQGLPTSPLIANLAAAPMDDDIMRLRPPKGRFTKAAWVYTRYADDLCFSFDRPGTAQMLLAEIPKIVERHGFKLNPAKTRLQYAGAGRRIVTGVAVDDQGVHVPREVKRRLRAMSHQIQHGLTRRGLHRLLARQRELARHGETRIPLNILLRRQWEGLTEWAKLKLPQAYAASGLVTPAQARLQVQRQQKTFTTTNSQHQPAAAVVTVRPYERKFA